MRNFDPINGVTLNSAAPITQAQLQVYDCALGCTTYELAITNPLPGNWKLAPAGTIAPHVGEVVVLRYTTENDCCACWRWLHLAWPLCPPVSQQGVYTPTTTATPGVVAVPAGEPGGPIPTCAPITV